jgi:hypothetical protein
MFLERSPTLATVGSSGSALSRAGTMGGGGGGCTRKQMLGPARSELRIIENHQHDNYATVSGGSLGGGSDHCGRLERGEETTNAGPPVLLQLQDIVRSRQPSQRPSLQSMFSAQGSLLQLESATPVSGGSLQDNSVGGGGGSSMQNLKQGSGSLDDPSPFSTLKKRKVSQPSPLPPPPSKLVYGSSPKLPQQQNVTAAGSPTTEQQRVGGVPQEAAAAPHSLAMSSSAAVASSDSGVSATPGESAANNSSLLPHRSWRGHCFPKNNPSIAMTFIFIRKPQQKTAFYQPSFPQFPMPRARFFSSSNI